MYSYTMSACCMPACGRASMLFSIWTMMGAPAAMNGGSPCDGTSMSVVNESFQSAASGSCLRLTAVCGIDSWYWWLCPSLRSSVALLPSLDQLTFLLSTGLLFAAMGVFVVFIGWGGSVFT